MVILLGRIQDFSKEGVVILRIQSKRPKAKEKGEGGGWRVGRGRVGRVRVRVMFEYVDFLHFDFRGI